MRIVVLLLIIVLASCGRGGVEEGVRPSEPGAATLPRSAAPARVELFDAHIHYSQDAWALYSPEQVIEICSRYAETSCGGR